MPRKNARPQAKIRRLRKLEKIAAKGETPYWTPPFNRESLRSKIAANLILFANERDKKDDS